MGYAAEKTSMTAAEFLAWDANQSLRREFVRGAIYARAGSDDRHVTVSGNVAMLLRAHLRGTACRTFIVDIKLRVEAADAFFYPDVMVTCSAADAADPLVKREPMLVVEVLSPATEAYDRGEKFAAYRMLVSLREYLLIDPQSRRCDLYRLGAEGLWVLHPFEPEQTVRLDSVGLDLDALALWEEVAPASKVESPRT